MNDTQLMSALVIAFVKALGGDVTITSADFQREPNEVVEIHQLDDGYRLIVKDRTIVDI